MIIVYSLLHVKPEKLYAFLTEHHGPAALTQGRASLVPFGYQVGWGPQSRSGRGGEEKNSQPPPGIET
jgi:hypothetical protein